MQTFPIPRDKPYVWATWLRSLISGEASCEWAAWFRAHNKFTKRPNTSDDGQLALWQIEHTALLSSTRDRLRREGYTVYLEQQNAFKVISPIGTLAGKPDIIAIKGREAWVMDVKTKSVKVKDRAQVMLYMWALKHSNLINYRNLTFDGRLINPNSEVIIPSDEVTPSFVDGLRSLLRRVCDDKPPYAAPSGGECRFCDISSDDCSVRMDELKGDDVCDDEVDDAF